MPDDDRTQWYTAQLTQLIAMLEWRDAAPDVGYFFGSFPSFAMDVDGDMGSYAVTIRAIPNPSVKNAIDLGLDVVSHILLMIEEDYSNWPKHARRTVDTYGVYVDPVDLETLPDDVYRRVYPLARMVMLPVQVLRQRIRSLDSDALAIVDWKDGKELITYGGLPRDGARFEDLRPAWDAVADIGGIKPHLGGSPPGPRKGQLWSRHHCLEWWRSWTAFDGKPTQAKLAADMGLSENSPETAVKRWLGAGLSWPPTDEQLEEEEQEMEDT